MAFISYTERPILALGLAGEAGAGLIWADFNFVMTQQAPIPWALNSWAAQANHGHPSAKPAFFERPFEKNKDEKLETQEKYKALGNFHIFCFKSQWKKPAMAEISLKHLVCISSEIQ